jgi:hypothetical protein
MKVRILLTVAGVLALATTAATGERTVMKTVKKGKQSITTLDTIKPPPDLKVGEGVKPPPVEGKQEFGSAWARGVVLDAKDWLCGRCFTDEFGRRWCLVYGAPFAEKPGAVSGWLLHPVDGGLHFYSTNGRLYRHTNPGAVPVMHQAEVVAVPRR